MTVKTDMREEALDTLLDIERNHTLSHIALSNTLLRLQFIPKQDRAFLTRLTEGVMERRITLEYILNQFSKTPLHKCKPLIRCLLLLSAYQILYMNVPDSAACNEAVRLAKKRGFSRLSGFVNGVLRNLSRGKEHLVIPEKSEDLTSYLSVRYSVAHWLVCLIVDQYGEAVAEKMFAAFLESKDTTIRTNLSKVTTAELVSRLEEENVKVKQGVYLPYALHISGYDFLSKLASFREGFFAVQDESSMLPVEIADIQPGQVIMDLCAAPGGKTYHAADLTGEKGKVISGDLTEYKTDLLRENQDRMGFDNVEIRQWDATKAEPTLFGKADLVLADLPCSGLGIMGRKNDIKYNIRQEQLEELVQLQRQILQIAWKYLKPGGKLVFSTCTMNKHENEYNTKWIEENTPLRLHSIEEKLPEALRGRTGHLGYLQLIPGIDACDGFFVSCFILPDNK